MHYGHHYYMVTTYVQSTFRTIACFHGNEEYIEPSGLRSYSDTLFLDPNRSNFRHSLCCIYPRDSGGKWRITGSLDVGRNELGDLGFTFLRKMFTTVVTKPGVSKISRAVSSHVPLTNSLHFSSFQASAVVCSCVNWIWLPNFHPRRHARSPCRMYDKRCTGLYAVSVERLLHWPIASSWSIDSKDSTTSNCVTWSEHSETLSRVATQLTITAR